MLRDGGGSVVGSYGSDQATFAWSLAWWPHAIEHGLHPLLTDLVYAPDGWNLAWTSSIPGPALLAWPLTAAFGPGGRLRRPRARRAGARGLVRVPLCRELGTGTPAALAGGLVFGFTTYEAAETLNHLNLALVFTLPLAGLVVARYLRGALSDRRFVVLFALCVLGVFATFLETLFWATLGGAFALVAGLACTRGRERALLVPLPPAVQRRLRDRAGRRVAVPVGRAGAPRPARHQRPGYELDLANLLVPTRVTALRPSPLHDLAARLGEQQPHRAARLRRPVLPALAGFALWERRREPLARVLGGGDRRGHAVRARLAARRGRAPHVARAAVDARRRPPAREPRAARRARSCSCGSRWP